MGLRTPQAGGRSSGRVILPAPGRFGPRLAAVGGTGSAAKAPACAEEALHERGDVALPLGSSPYWSGRKREDRRFADWPAIPPATRNRSPSAAASLEPPVRAEKPPPKRGPGHHRQRWPRRSLAR